MQSKISTTQLELFNESALPEAVTLHADRPGFFSLLIKPSGLTPRQSSYRVDLLPQVLDALDPDIDSYMSQATFFRPNRRLVNLWHLPLCFVDLDTYKTAYGKLHEEPLSLAVRQRLADVGNPARVSGDPLGPRRVPEMAVAVSAAPGGVAALECRAA